MNAAAGEASETIGRKLEPKGLVSRRWSQAVLNGAALSKAYRWKCTPS